mmetsp:Transcript_2053/g.3896  ORF Transcript_2053/g.3896 Transcript_2053/m.3896 type:complete len:102 (-) Transcript_2053:165-470(-)
MANQIYTGCTSTTISERFGMANEKWRSLSKQKAPFAHNTVYRWGVRAQERGRNMEKWFGIDQNDTTFSGTANGAIKMLQLHQNDDVWGEVSDRNENFKQRR